MVGIGIDHISITRILPIEPAAIGHVLARLRAETSGTTARWNLGDRGGCDLEVTFARVGDLDCGEPAFVSTAALWNPRRDACVKVSVSLAPCEERESELTLHPEHTLGEWFAVNLAAYLDLAHAAIEELAQELLYQQTRVRDELAG
jgi:hypothetical protein